MTYIVKVEKNYEPLTKCLQTLTIPRSPRHTLLGLHLEFAKKVKEVYNIKCNLVETEGTLVWETLEFESEQVYLIWLMKYS